MKKILLGFLLFFSVSAFATVMVENATPMDLNAPQNNANQAAPTSGQISQLKQQVRDLQMMVEAQGQTIKHLQTGSNNLTAPTLTSTSTSTPKIAPKTTPNTIPTQKMVSVSHHSSSTQDEGAAIYQSAFNSIHAKQYSSAINGFQQYLGQYPKGKYAANSHYWLGQLYMLSGNGDQAKAQFKSIVSDYSGSNKAPDAMLKLGTMASDASDMATAKQWWQELINKYPNSGAARVAQTQLNQAEQTGN